MALTVGSRLGHYDVTALIGEGGMGQVYRATDTQLGRDVALKILPDAFAADPDRLARFQREAQVLASLNHPGIAAIYGIETSDETQALVLELVEGPTLADRIANGPIPLDEALPIAKQIAEALEAAHEAGVIHRDLKPANIKVREDGTVKVLDFGLAKALDTTPEGDPSQSPTLTAAATQMGVILGTAAYMSPEQAKGKVVDKRANVWAFGAVLYEMLTGAKPFTGADVSDTLGAVLRLQINTRALPEDTPPRVCQVIIGCLQKDPKERLRDIGDVRLAMQGTFESAVATAPGASPSQRLQLWQRPVPAVAIALIMAGIAAIMVWRLVRTDPPDAEPIRFIIRAPENETLNVASVSPDVAISSDGHRLAYLIGNGLDTFGPKRLLLRSLRDLIPTTLADGAPLYQPFFSPDGQWLGFYDAGDLQLRRVSAQGGSALPICDLDSGLRGASWSDEDTIIFATDSGLWRVVVNDGAPEQLTTPDVGRGELEHHWPEALPGGRSILFTVVADPIENSQIAVLSLDTLDWQVLVRGGTHARYASTGHLLYTLQDTLWAVGFDLDRLATAGAPVPVVEGVATKPTGAASYSVSRNGSLVYVPGQGMEAAERTLVWVDLDGVETALPAAPRPYESARISPDGRAVAVEVRDGSNRDVIVYDLQRDTSDSADVRRRHRPLPDLECGGATRGVRLDP